MKGITKLGTVERFIGIYVLENVKIIIKRFYKGFSIAADKVCNNYFLFALNGRSLAERYSICY